MSVFQKNSSHFESSITSHYYEFNPSRPMWKFFDVSSCLAQLDKLYLKVTLDGKLIKYLAFSDNIWHQKRVCLKITLFFLFFPVSYTLLVQFSLQKAHDSIRKAIAGISGISPLRISHLYVSIGKLNLQRICFESRSVSTYGTASAWLDSSAWENRAQKKRWQIFLTIFWQFSFCKKWTNFYGWKKFE